MFTKFYTKSLMFLKIALVIVLVLTVFAACKKQAEEQTQGAVQKETVAAVAVEETGSAIIEADQLKKYIDNGYKTDDGKKVLILHVTLQNGTLPEITIKGAYAFSQEEYLMEKRSDGVAPNGAMVASGAKVDGFLSKYGVDKDTVIVLTSHDLTNQMIYRTFWALKYWGFTNDNLKVLNGANYYFFNQFAKDNNIANIDTYKAAPADIASIKPTTFSVRDLPANNIDSLRAPFGEVLEYVKIDVLSNRNKLYFLLIATQKDFALQIPLSIT